MNKPLSPEEIAEIEKRCAAIRQPKPHNKPGTLIPCSYLANGFCEKCGYMGSLITIECEDVERALATIQQLQDELEASKLQQSCTCGLAERMAVVEKARESR